MNCKTLMTAVSFLAVSAAAADTRPRISVVGNGKVDAEFIMSVFPDKKVYGESDTDQAIKDLFATHAFSDVRVDKRGSGIVVTVVETPVVVKTVFVGNKRLTTDQLVSVAALDPGAPFDPLRMPEVVARIEQAYAAKGRRHAKITPNVTSRDNDFYDVSFNIDEGDRSETVEIWFEGNSSFPASKLRSLMVTRPTTLLSKLFSRDVLDAGQLEGDRRRIEAFYRSEGFADVIISDAEIDFGADGQSGMAGFRIVEGSRYSVGTVSFENSTASELPVAAVLDAKRLEGQTYDLTKATKAADAISKAMEETSAAGTIQVVARPNRLADGRVDVAYAVDVGQKVYVERIEIAGNETTKDYVIRREFDLSEGDIFNPRLVREAERRLNRLGFFDRVAITTTKGSTDDSVVLRVEVIERKTGEFSIGGAYSTTDGPMAIVSMSQSNFGGTGRAFSASAGQGTETGNYDFSFTEPYIFGHRLSATAQVFHKNYAQRTGGFRPFDETLDGAKFTLKGPITANTDLDVYYSLAKSSKSNIAHEVDGRLVPSGEHVVSSIGYDLFYSDLDDERNPANGLRITFGQQFAGLGGDATFVKTETSARAYRELSERHEIVGSMAVRGGQVAGIGKDLAFADHFRSVGDLVRGFENGGIGPRDASSGYLLGGQYYAAATAEVIYPIPVLTDGLGVRGSIFADIGTVWGANARTVSSSGASALNDNASLRASLGTGVVWDSPFGLLKANFAVPLSKADGDRTQVFSISGGTRF